MGVNEIVINIKQQVNLKKEQLEEEFLFKEKELLSKLEVEYQELKNIRLEQVKKEVLENYQGQLMSIKLDSRKTILALKKQMILDIIDQIKKDFTHFVGKENYYTFIKNKATEFAESGDMIYLAAQDISYKETLLKDLNKENIQIQSKDILGGIIITKKDANYNFSLESLFEDHLREIEQIIGEKIHVFH